MVCAIAASRKLRLWQIDFVSAFLNSESMFDIYMEQPRGFEEGGDDLVWKLWKILYGTMQGAHNWAKNLDHTFEGHEYYRLRADPQIQSRVTKNELTLILTWTDDILRASSTLEGKTLAKKQLRSSYKIKDIGEEKLILGIKISQSKNGDIVISQRAYAKQLLKRFNMHSFSPLTIPLPYGLSLSMEDCPANTSEIGEMRKVPYCKALGSLMWMQVAT